MGRGQNPHVHRNRLRAADPLERHFLKHAQQLGLDLQVDVADFVEEQRAAVGLLEPSDPIAVGPRERAFDVAESSLSSKLCESAAQCSLTNGREARGLA